MRESDPGSAHQSAVFTRVCMCVFVCIANDDSDSVSYERTHTTTSVRCAAKVRYKNYTLNTISSRRASQPNKSWNQHLITILLNIILLFHSVFSHRPLQTYFSSLPQPFRVFFTFSFVVFVPCVACAPSFVCVFKISTISSDSHSRQLNVRVKYFGCTQSVSVCRRGAHFVQSLLNFIVCSRSLTRPLVLSVCCELYFEELRND